MNPFTAIPNKIMEALARTRIAGTQRQVLDAICRQTFGYGKERDTISSGALANATGLARKHAHRAVIELAERRIITVLRTGDRKPLTLGINPYVEQWLSPNLGTEDKATIPKTGDSIEGPDPNHGDMAIPNPGDNKRNKETKNIHIYRSVLKTGDSVLVKKLLKVSGRFHARQRRQHPDLIKPKDVRSRILPGVETLEKLIRIDGHDFDTEVRPALLYALRDGFWSEQIRSLACLRTKSKNGETKFRNLLASAKSTARKGVNHDQGMQQQQRTYTGTQADSHWLRSGGGGDGNVPEARAVSG